MRQHPLAYSFSLSLTVGSAIRRDPTASAVTLTRISTFSGFRIHSLLTTPHCADLLRLRQKDPSSTASHQEPVRRFSSIASAELLHCTPAHLGSPGQCQRNAYPPSWSLAGSTLELDRPARVSGFQFLFLYPHQRPYQAHTQPTLVITGVQAHLSTSLFAHHDCNRMSTGPNMHVETPR
ncbi:hypothetical protein FJTKL_15513 [Diaporthe vaccinii]|uniref:Uncharacterized protein n=1 Tax=Diaporthe vaccinii TaxID=105482 RepID=A0ABR4F6U8_9PEZI